MPPSAAHLRTLADVIVRVGVNLQPGQPLLITDPYELHGVPPDALGFAEILGTAARSATKVLTADLGRLRALAEADDLRGFDTLVSAHVRQLRAHLAAGGAFLFLTGGHPGLCAGLPAERLNRFERLKWRHLGPVIQQLIHGATQWTLVPAVTTAWADAAFADRAAPERLPALWDSVLRALRIADADSGPDLIGSVANWQTHLEELTLRRDALNRARHRFVHYVGPGTDIRFELARSHQWCTAQLATRRGLPFVVNLPTEEVFTAPHKHSAQGRMRVSRPVAYSGGVITGIELEFHRGRVVQASADSGADLLRELLATDAGAAQIGEIAVVGSEGQRAKGETSWQTARPLFHHTLLDENAANHLALGDAYRFCSRALVPLALNSSQVHVDLAVDAEVRFT